VFASLTLRELITKLKLCKYSKRNAVKISLKYVPENKVFLEKVIGPLSCQQIPCRPHSFTVGSLRVHQWSASNTHQPIIFLTVSSSEAYILANGLYNSNFQPKPFTYFCCPHICYIPCPPHSPHLINPIIFGYHYKSLGK
jgi:hypothetical protein